MRLFNQIWVSRAIILAMAVLTCGVMAFLINWQLSMLNETSLLIDNRTMALAKAQVTQRNLDSMESSKETLQQQQTKLADQVDNVGGAAGYTGLQQMCIAHNVSVLSANSATSNGMVTYTVTIKGAYADLNALIDGLETQLFFQITNLSMIRTDTGLVQAAITATGKGGW